MSVYYMYMSVYYLQLFVPAVLYVEHLACPNPEKEKPVDVLFVY